MRCQEHSDRQACIASADIYLLGRIEPDVPEVHVGRDGTVPCDVDVLVGVGMSLVGVGVGVVVDVGGDVGVLVVGCGCEVGVGSSVELEVGCDSLVVLVSVVVVLEDVVVEELVGGTVDRGGGSTEPGELDAVTLIEGGSELGIGVDGADSFVCC